MTASSGNTANPFGNNAEIGVGFDAALLAASAIDFILASTVSSTVLMHVMPQIFKEVKKGGTSGRKWRREAIAHGVSALDRFQHGTCASVLKQQRLTRQELIKQNLMTPSTRLRVMRR
jgi:hypothetical protein